MRKIFVKTLEEQGDKAVITGMQIALWDRIMTTLVPGVAAQNPFSAQP